MLKGTGTGSGLPGTPARAGDPTHLCRRVGAPMREGKFLSKGPRSPLSVPAVGEARLSSTCFFLSFLPPSFSLSLSLIHSFTHSQSYTESLLLSLALSGRGAAETAVEKTVILFLWSSESSRKDRTLGEVRMVKSRVSRVGALRTEAGRLGYISEAAARACVAPPPGRWSLFPPHLLGPIDGRGSSDVSAHVVTRSETY